MIGIRGAGIRSKTVWAGTLTLILFFVISARHTLGETLVLDSGERLKSGRVTYDDKGFTTDDGRTIERARVVDWWLAQEGQEQQVAADQSEHDGQTAIRRLQAYRHDAQALANRYPGVGGIHVVDEGIHSLTHDKRHVYRYHFVGLILSDDYLSWGEIQLGFTEGRSRVRILGARCLGADDTLHVLAPDDITVTKPSGGDVHFDLNSRMKSAVIPGVGKGAVIEYVYEYENFLPEDWRLFFPGYYFQGDVPVWRSTFEIRIPVELRLHYWTENWDVNQRRPWYSRILSWVPFIGPPRGTARGRMTDDNGHVFRTYRWEKHRMPPITKEPRMPPWYEVAPAVHGTLFKDWDHLNRLTGAMQRERMQATPEIRQLVHQITSSSETPAQKTAALYHWVQKNIRYVSVKGSLSSGWAGHPAQQTLDQGYGDCTDKSILFSTMLRVIGIDAEPVVVRTNDRGRFVPKYPVLACNHCITEVELQGKRLFLDPTSQDYRFPYFRSDDHGVLAFNFIEGERHAIPVPPGMDAHGKSAVSTMTLRPTGELLVDSRNRYTGSYEANLRGGWKRVPRDLQQQVVQQHLNTIAPGARLATFTMSPPEDLSQQFTLSYSYLLPNYPAEADSYRLLPLPDRDMRFPEVSLEERSYPLVYTTSQSVRHTVTLHLPEDLEIVELPPDVEIVSKHIKYLETFRVEDHTIHFSSEFERSSRRIPPPDYRVYRRTVLRIQDQTQKPIYLRRK
ncbi:MAG: DUF3857 domain-containing protein [Candidatus Pacebacteria bacterium]|nr:DUF3857 domain-containing protein [Candidatus Paceibacterota bacterium]